MKFCKRAAVITVAALFLFSVTPQTFATPHTHTLVLKCETTHPHWLYRLCACGYIVDLQSTMPEPLSTCPVCYPSITEDSYYGSLNISYPFRDGTIPKRISSRYGPRNINVEGSSTEHGGIDIPAGINTNLYPVFDAIVRHIGFQLNGAGNYVIAEALDAPVYKGYTQFRFAYAHLVEPADTSNPNVKNGKVIYKSELIGKVGKSGVSSGYHLHLSLITDGSLSFNINNTVDPELFYPNFGFTY